MERFSLRDFLLGGLVFKAIGDAVGRRRYGFFIVLILIALVLLFLYLVSRIIKFVIFGIIPAVFTGLRDGFRDSRKMFLEARQSEVPATTDPSSPSTAQSAPAFGHDRVCPMCAETIKAAALVCRFCGRRLNDLPPV